MGDGAGRDPGGGGGMINKFPTLGLDWRMETRGESSKILGILNYVGLPRRGVLGSW